MQEGAKRPPGRPRQYEPNKPYQGGAPRLATRVDPDVLKWTETQPEGTRPFIERVVRKDRDGEECSEMLTVNFALCHPESDEMDCSVTLRMPAVPQPGDGIQILRTGKAGAEYFVVRSTRWNINENDEEEPWLQSVWVTAEYADGPNAHEDHRKLMDTFRKNKRKVQVVSG